MVSGSGNARPGFPAGTCPCSLKVSKQRRQEHNDAFSNVAWCEVASDGARLGIGAWIVTGTSAFAHGGGGGGGGHGGGGGRGGGGHSGGGYHGGGGGNHGGYYHSGYGYYGGIYPGYYFGSGYYGYPGYGYGYNNGYAYPYYNSGYGYNYPTYTYDNSVYPAATQGRYLGIDELAVNDSAGPGMQVMRVYPGSAAEQAGLQPGDVILSANGYVTQQSGNLAWIIATVPSGGLLQMNVHTVRDAAVHAVTARIP